MKPGALTLRVEGCATAFRINEAAVRRVVGGPAVMAAQLRSLASARDRAVVTVQVLPFSAGEHPAMTGSFVTLAFSAPDPGAVYLENAASALYLERPADVAWYAEVAANLPAVVAVRDSKDRSGPVLIFGHADWKDFTAQLRKPAVDPH